MWGLEFELEFLVRFTGYSFTGHLTCVALTREPGHTETRSWKPFPAKRPGETYGGTLPLSR